MRSFGRYALLAASVLAAVVAVGAGLWCASGVNAAMGMFAPFIVAISIVVISWVLFGQRRSDDGQNPSLDRTECPECSREVLGQWRMCPYCGAMLAGHSAAGGSTTER